MGLDSVEILMEWEDFLSIRIPDLEAAKMFTIGDAVTYISDHIDYVERELDIKAEVFSDLKMAFSQVGRSISMSSSVFKVLSETEEDIWKKISGLTRFELPLPFSTSKLGKIFGQIFSRKVADNDLTFSRYCDLICALNYQKLIPEGRVKNRYEVMVAVMGITIEKSGINPFKVFCESSFLNDLGIS